MLVSDMKLLYWYWKPARRCIGQEKFKTYQRVYRFNAGTIHSELKMIKYWYFESHTTLKKINLDFDFQRTHQGAHPTSYQWSASPEENYSSHNRSRSSRLSWSSRSSWSSRLRGLWRRWLWRIRSPRISVNHPKVSWDFNSYLSKLTSGESECHPIFKL